MPDLGVEPERRLDGVALEPPVEELACAARREIPQVALRAARKKCELPAQREGAQAAAPAPVQVGRCLEDESAQRIRRCFDGAVVVGQALRVARGKPGQFPLGIGEGRSQPERTVVGQGQEIREGALEDFQSVLGQAQVADHLGVKQAHRVGGRGIAKSGSEFLGYRRAAHHGAPLEYAHLEPRAGEVAGAHEAVVAAADDDDIVGH